jgi:MFS family permease
VHDTLGQGTVTVGLVMGAQYVASLFGRMWAGGMTDRRGPKRAALIGLAAACGVGALYLAAGTLTQLAPELSLAFIIGARLLSGLAESFVITSTMAWGLARVGPAHAGKVSFQGVALAVLVAGLVGFALTSLFDDVTPSHLPRLSFLEVLDTVKLPGLGLTLCTAGYATITAFSVLLFSQRGWAGGALTVSFMGMGFIASRLLFGHLADRVGGARVALLSVLAEAIGLTLIWAAPDPVFAWIGAALGGGGYGLGFQGFGLEAVRRTPAQSRGAAMGAYVIFQDIAMGLAPPLGGALAHRAGLDAAFLAASIGALGSAIVASALLWRSTVAQRA